MPMIHSKSDCIMLLKQGFGRFGRIIFKKATKIFDRERILMYIHNIKQEDTNEHILCTDVLPIARRFRRGCWATRCDCLRWSAIPSEAL